MTKRGRAPIKNRWNAREEQAKQFAHKTNVSKSNLRSTHDDHVVSSSRLAFIMYFEESFSCAERKAET